MKLLGLKHQRNIKNNKESIISNITFFLLKINYIQLNGNEKIFNINAIF